MRSASDARWVTGQALAAGELLLACNTAREALLSNDDLALRHDLAKALLGLRSYEEALNETLRILSDPTITDRLRRDALLLAGEIHFEAAAEESIRENRVMKLAAAAECYHDAADLSPYDHDAHVRLAVSLLVLAHARLPAETADVRSSVTSGDVSNAEESAARALPFLANAKTFEQLVDRAESQCVLGRFDEAGADYRAAVALPGTGVHRLGTARRRARLIAGVKRTLGGALDVRDSLFDQCFPPLQLLVFYGHLFDGVGGVVPQFASSAEESVRNRIRVELERLQARVGFSSAAAGPELLFVEEMLYRGAELHIVLPWAREAFRQTSVLPFGNAWARRFDEALERAASIRTLGEQYVPSDRVSYLYATTVMGGLARLTARSLGVDLLPVALCDGPLGSAGGAAQFVEFWRDQGIAPEIIPLPRADAHAAERIKETSAPPASRPMRREGFRQEVKTMLFADIVGYSHLPEAAIPGFVTEFMGQVSRAIAESAYAPISVNTWGDALYFVFDRAEDGGVFALELMEMIERTNWEQRGVFWEEHVDGRTIRHPLSLRTALHTGPAFVHFDPVVRRLGYTGAHVSRAARIEPITTPGDVYASEEFAATAAVERVSGFSCHFVGTMPLAKKYPGVFRIYRIRRTQSFPIETLGRLIHEAYCRERGAAGQTSATTPSLRSWDDLPDDLRSSNREQAADIPMKLHLIGYELLTDPRRQAIPGAMAPDDAAFVKALRDNEDVLARHEHERWCREKARRGWTEGRRDDTARQHPDLVPWEKLDATAQGKDREAVRNIPALLAAAGFRIQKRR